MTNSPIPTIDVLPPMSAGIRDILYGILAWAAGLLTLATTVIALVPEWNIVRPLTVANAVVLGLWTLGGFKAKANVTPATDVVGRHEAQDENE